MAPSHTDDDERTSSVEDHLALVLRSVQLLPPERVGVDAALGRTLREPVHAASPLPPFDNSAMDGFAVRFADVASATPSVPATLRVVAELPAGTDADPPLAPGSCVRIMTGAPVPSAADTVVPFEDTVDDFGASLPTVSIARAPLAVGAHIRRAGEDVSAGDEIVGAGTRLGPLQLAAIAATGVPNVLVSRVPRIAVISTGDELVDPGSPLRRGQIPESNSRMLAALAAETGCAVVCRTSVPDQRGRLLDLLAEVTAADSSDRADVVVFSGGVSAGAFDVVKEALTGTIGFASVAMRPGRPQAFGLLPDGTVVFGLPGNPVSAAVSFEAFVRPALLRMQGRLDARPSVLLPAASGWRSPTGTRQYVPVIVDRSDPARWVAVPVGPRGSHRAGALARSDGYAVVPEHVDAIEPGDLVDVLLTS